MNPGLLPPPVCEELVPHCSIRCIGVRYGVIALVGSHEEVEMVGSPEDHCNEKIQNLAVKVKLQKNNGNITKRCKFIKFF